ncbi:hypothetical protein EM20IM_03395 [Candidatus Methylacidiphilum infernorum]|uniref:Uncharacterized protein n=1 Tax=Candidatus Methylacidiphilum infernorum TaxID=511746 RepID=A0ABX7PXV4_9BACT|nr:hypothetical protein [Candidatus Methylacidiphilum infernorum]QSR87386.1 hypothetical protein EM20IM_03395 [Candidatus Methylacidiphilum infernorum]
MTKKSGLLVGDRTSFVAMLLTQASAPKAMLEDEIARLNACSYPGVNLAIPRVTVLPQLRKVDGGQE